jgi:hypothetical protein
MAALKRAKAELKNCELTLAASKARTDRAAASCCIKVDPAASIKMLLPDNWSDNSTCKCQTCRFYVLKASSGTRPIGRCRRRCPVVEIGYPAVYPTDWCGEHKIDENKI